MYANFKRFLGLVLVLALLITAMPVAALANGSYYGSTTTAHTTSGNRKNIKLAIERIDGTSVDNGDTFSFNDVVGSRSEGKGYVSAINGRGVSVRGGGVAQVAATIYLAIKDYSSDFRIREKHIYGADYDGEYVESGDDAIVVDYSAGTDFRFTNRTGDKIIINMWLDSDSDELRCSITKQGRRIARSYTDIIGNKAKKNNISLAVEAINGTMLESGDKFSFNSIVGARSSRRGYKEAINGRGVEVMGGGVAQVASTLYLAIKNKSDFKIIDKTTYGNAFNDNYVDDNRDAIVTDYSADTDFSFRYNGYGSIQILMSVVDGEVKCEIYESDGAVG